LEQRGYISHPVPCYAVKTSSVASTLPPAGSAGVIFLNIRGRWSGVFEGYLIPVVELELELELELGMLV